MDLHIQMTKNGFGQYRPNADQWIIGLSVKITHNLLFYNT